MLSKKDIHGDKVKIGDTIRFHMGWKSKDTSRGIMKVPVWKEVLVKEKTYIPDVFEIV